MGTENRPPVREDDGVLYIHRLSPTRQGRRPGTLAFVCGPDGPHETVLAAAVELATSRGAALCVLCLLEELPIARREALVRSQEAGDLLTVAVLQLAKGALPAEATIVVYQGTARDAARFLNQAVRPDLAIVSQSNAPPLDLAMLRADCPVIQLDDPPGPAGRCGAGPDQRQAN